MLFLCVMVLPVFVCSLSAGFELERGVLGAVRFSRATVFNDGAFFFQMLGRRADDGRAANATLHIVAQFFFKNQSFSC